MSHQRVIASISNEKSITDEIKRKTVSLSNAEPGIISDARAADSNMSRYQMRNERILRSRTPGKSLYLGPDLNEPTITKGDKMSESVPAEEYTEQAPAKYEVIHQQTGASAEEQPGYAVTTTIRATKSDHIALVLSYPDTTIKTIDISLVQEYIKQDGTFRFICSKCMCIDDADLVLPGSYVVNDSHPSHDIYEMVDPGNKAPMLCSECNTGTWHGDFDKTKATPEEIAIASFSKVNAVTPLDHVPRCLTLDDTKPNGYGLSKTCIIMFNQAYQYAIDNGLKYMPVTKHPLYRKWEEAEGYLDMDELINCDMGDEKARREAHMNSGAVKDTGEGVPGLDNVDIEKVAASLAPKKHWKELQSEESKEEALEKAKLKRERKASKK